MSAVARQAFYLPGFGACPLSVDQGQSPGRQGTWPMYCKSWRRPSGGFVISRSSALP